jgi:hypothetical protein
MSTRSLKNKLKKVEAALPPPPPPYEELPIEEWVEEEVRSAFPETTLKNTTDEEHFFAWLEKLPLTLGSRISIIVGEARHEGWTIYDPHPTSAPRSELARGGCAAPSHRRAAPALGR